MQIRRLIEELTNPAIYPGGNAAIEVVQTHISVVFLVGEAVYKLKKPVRLPFLDFSTLAKRKHYCDQEVRLNRRLAPHVYRGVVPILRVGDGLGLGQPTESAVAPEAIDYLVSMVRLPAARTLEAQLERGELEHRQLADLATRLARFHADAEAGPVIDRGASFATVSRNCLDNYAHTRDHVGVTATAPLHHRLEERTATLLEHERSRIERRAAAGVARDTHGDLHLEHVYTFPEVAPPGDVAVIDCIEFNPEFRHADPVADMAFLYMDLAFRGRRDLARTFADAYFEASGDDDGRPLLSLYCSYRAAVRAKVEGIQAVEPEVPADSRAAAITRARAHWLFALGELAGPLERPALILMAGLPGTGKSTVARRLAAPLQFEVVRSDVVRKELAARDETADPYADAWSDRTYAECLARARRQLADGGRVIIDANFRTAARRAPYLATAAELGVPVRILICRAAQTVAEQRLRARTGDASDADVDVYRRLQTEWEEPLGSELELAIDLHSGGPVDAVVEDARSALRTAGLASPAGEPSP